jgi:probable addiction module antidote protein
MKSKKSDFFIKEMIAEDLELQLAYLQASFEDNYDAPEAILSAIKDIAEVRGVASLAAASNLNRENLYRVLSGNTYPRIDTFFKIISALGMRLSVDKKKYAS